MKKTNMKAPRPPQRLFRERTYLQIHGKPQQAATTGNDQKEREEEMVTTTAPSPVLRSYSRGDHLIQHDPEGRKMEVLFRSNKATFRRSYTEFPTKSSSKPEKVIADTAESAPQLYGGDTVSYFKITAPPDDSDEEESDEEDTASAAPRDPCHHQQNRSSLHNLQPLLSGRHLLEEGQSAHPTNAMAVPSVISLHEQGAYFTGSFDINNTSNYYMAYKLYSNSSAKNNYILSPTTGQIAPYTFQKVTVSLIKPHFWDYLTRKDRIVVHSVTTPTSLDKKVLDRYLRHVFLKYPTVGEKAMLRMLLISSKDKLASPETQKKLQMGRSVYRYMSDSVQAFHFIHKCNAQQKYPILETCMLLAYIFFAVNFFLW